MNKLDVLALAYMNGDRTVLEEMCKIVLPLVVSKSEEVWYKLKNNAEFECRCLRKLERLLSKFDPEKGSFSSLVYSTVMSERKYFLKNRKSNEYLYIDDLAVVDDEGNIEEYKIPDERTSNIEEHQVMKESLHEKITLLAQGDPRRQMILNAWIDGCTNDSELASVLAHRFGGNSKSHRVFISRFRKECKKRLENKKLNIPAVLY